MNKTKITKILKTLLKEFDNQKIKGGDENIQVGSLINKEYKEMVMKVRGNVCEDVQCNLKTAFIHSTDLFLYHKDRYSNNNCRENIILLCADCYKNHHFKVIQKDI